MLIGGAAVSVFAALTGFWDWLRSTPKGTQARRTVNAHALTMVVLTAVVLVAIGLRWFAWDGHGHTPAAALGISVLAAALTFVGGSIGGSLVYDYGFNVETAGDHPAWHPSETDQFPDGRRQPVAAALPSAGGARSSSPGFRHVAPLVRSRGRR